jgi:hypothetical protein
VKGVDAREQFLNHIIEYDKYLGEHVFQVTMKSAIFELLYNMRLLTINVAECLSQWRYSIARIIKMYSINMEGSIVFTYKGKNYLTKMYDDLNFLKNSHIARYTNISATSDPLLLAPSKSDSHRVGKKQIIITVPPPLKSRVIAAIDYITNEHKGISDAKIVGKEAPTKTTHVVISDYHNENIANLCEQNTQPQSQLKQPLAEFASSPSDDISSNKNNLLITSGNAIDHQDFNSLMSPPQHLEHNYNVPISIPDNPSQISFALSNLITKQENSTRLNAIKQNLLCITNNISH